MFDITSVLEGTVDSLIVRVKYHRSPYCDSQRQCRRAAMLTNPLTNLQTNCIIENSRHIDIEGIS